MTAAMQWKREGKKSGPANLLNGRWIVLGGVSDWVIIDRTSGEIVSEGWTRMKDARMYAERLARKATS